MHYYIDGYNLLFRLHRPDKHALSLQRNQFIKDLSQKVQALGLHVTLVFDSQYHESESSRSHFQNMEIIFSEMGETADNCILNLIKREQYPQQCTVVTSDKKLAWFVRRADVSTQNVEIFIAWLNRRYANKFNPGKKIKKSQFVKAGDVPSEKPEQEIEKAKTKPSKPISSASFEECFEFYLVQFEEEFEKLPQIAVTRTVKKEEKPRKKRPKKAETESGVSDMERWLRAFERNADREEE